jgi:hypothetical protein
VSIEKEETLALFRTTREEDRSIGRRKKVQIKGNCMSFLEGAFFHCMKPHSATTQKTTIFSLELNILEY